MRVQRQCSLLRITSMDCVDRPSGLESWLCPSLAKPPWVIYSLNLLICKMGTTVPLSRWRDMTDTKQNKARHRWAVNRCVMLPSRLLVQLQPAPQAAFLQGGWCLFMVQSEGGRGVQLVAGGAEDELRLCGLMWLLCETLGVSVRSCQGTGSSGIRGPRGPPSASASSKMGFLPSRSPLPADSQLGVRALPQPLAECGWAVLFPQPHSSPPVHRLVLPS